MDTLHTDIFSQIFTASSVRECLRLAATAQRLNSIFWLWVRNMKPNECELCCVYSGRRPRSLIDSFRAVTSCPCGAIGWDVHRNCKCFATCRKCARVTAQISVAFGERYPVCKYSCIVNCFNCNVGACKETIADWVFYSLIDEYVNANVTAICSRCKVSFRVKFQDAIYTKANVGILSMYLLCIMRPTVNALIKFNAPYDPSVYYYHEVLALLTTNDPHNPSLALFEALAASK